MKFKAMTVAIVLFATSSVWAAKYVVVFKNPESFSQVHSQWVLSNQSVMNRMFSGARAPLEVLESLEAIHSVVVESRDEALVSAMASGSDVVIEKEIFHKAPAPITDFALTSAWDFDAQYAVSSDVLRKKRRPKPNRPTPPEPSSDSRIGTPWGINAVKAREAWALSKQGSGARVLVLDTGIDKNHPALKNQIEQTRDFVGDNQAPYDVADKIGHGTHVAGTIAAEEAADGFVGVAPKAKILMGRVCGAEGCSNIDVARGINWGIEEQVDVINLSLGGDVGTYAESSAVADAEKAGVIVVAASGNDGKPSVGFPAAFPTALAVGAVDVNLNKAAFSQWGPELDLVAPGVDVFSAVPLASGCEASAILTEGTNSKTLNSTCFSGSAFLAEGLKKELVFVGLGKPEDFTGKNLSGKFALIFRGEIKFSEKVQNALAANAAGVVIFNNTAGLMSGALTEDGSILAIPVVMIEQVAGESLKQSLAAGRTVALEVKTASADYASFSGTSMACPHTAGVAALVRAAQKSLTPIEVRNLLKETATVMGPNAQNEFGSGMVNAEKAVAKAAQIK